MSSAVSSQNQLISLLPQPVRREVVMRCETVRLESGEVISERGDRIDHVYFPTSGFITQLATVNEHSRLGMALVGSEGMAGVASLLDVPLSPMRAVAQSPGKALRLRVTEVNRLLREHPALSGLLNRYLYVLLSQLVQAAICTHVHRVDARLARWLLMAHDRAHTDCFMLTHAVLGELLGVRRSGISTAAAELQKKGILCYSRGHITVLKRHALERASCTCYGLTESTYRGILGEDDHGPRQATG